jgi:hypothetical protein
MVAIFFAKYWKQLILSIVLTVSAYIVYNYIYQRGVVDTTIVYEHKIKDYQDRLDKRISTIETNSVLLVSTAQAHTDLLNKDIDAIVLLSKKKSSFTINQGKCIPSTDFIDSYNSVINKANTR